MLEDVVETLAAALAAALAAVPAGPVPLMILLLSGEVVPGPMLELLPQAIPAKEV